LRATRRELERVLETGKKRRKTNKPDRQLLEEKFS
jgi:hypothetical protein